MKTSLLFLLLCFGMRADAESDWEFVFATTSLPVSAVTSTSDAKKSFIGEIYGPMGFKYNFLPFTVQLTTSKISLISNKDKDNGLSTTLTQLEGNYFFSLDSIVRWKAQMGILSYEMKGSGGQTELRNGTSTSTFDLPSRTTTSQMIYTGVGGGANIGSVNVGLDLNFLSILSNSRRSFFLSLYLGVPL